LEENNFLIATKNKSVEISGEGTRGRPIRVYLMYSENPFTINIFDNETNEKIMSYENCKTNRILYYRLKSNHKLVIKNKYGRVRIL
jgi:hypothetical protein